MEEQINILRHKYMPYSEKYAKQAWFQLAKERINNLQIGENQAKVWNQLIKYIHGDEKCSYDLHKSLCFIGQTGSGKTITMHIMNDYMNFDNIHYIRNGINMSFKFSVISSREIVAEYAKSGHDGIAKFMMIGNLCIDDLGAEPETTTYFGSKIDVITEIIETRYNKNLFTHFTSNLDESQIRIRYNDRVYSRIYHQSNIIILNDKDFRIN